MYGNAKTHVDKYQASILLYGRRSFCEDAAVKSRLSRFTNCRDEGTHEGRYAQGQTIIILSK